jgi:tetratricopeptide (TPR) repeat protein
MQVGLLGMQEILKNYPYQPLITGTGALGASLLQMKYSREAELEADAYGIKYMAGAGYDPQAAIALQKMFLRLSQNQKSHWLIGLFASHPPSEERIEANEKTARLYTKDAVLMDGQKEYAEAIASLQKTKPAGECLLKGTHALLAQNPQEALSWAQEGLRINPQGAHLHNLAGKAKLALNDFKGAFASFQKACDLNPSYFDFYLGLGLAEYNLNFHKAAREHLEKSLLFFPTAEAHITLGNIHLQNHDTPQALTHFQEASLADSPLGQKAKASFTRLDLITHPEHYITLTPSWNPHGNLSLHLKNSSQLPVHDIFLELAFKDVKGLTTTKPLRIPAVVPPGEDKTLTTSLSHDPALSLPTIKIINLEIYQYE